LTSGDKNFSDFPDKQPTKFYAVSRRIATKNFYHLDVFALGTVSDMTQYGV